MDFARFRATYPEFASASPELTQVALDRAALRTDAAVWGQLYDEGHGLLAAHLLSISPNGKFARAVPTSAKTGATQNVNSTYWIERERLNAEVSIGLRTT